MVSLPHTTPGGVRLTVSAMTDDESSTSNEERVTADEHPYRLPGLPPLPFDEDHGNSDRGDVVWAVIEFGRSNEDPQVDRVFFDEHAARTHAHRIRDEEHLPATAQKTRLE